MLVYTGEPLTEPLDVIGPVRLVAHVSTSAADTDVARSCSTCTRTASRSDCATALSGSATAPATTGRCRSSRERVYEVEVEMWDTAQRFLPGHRVRLEVASSAHPKFAVNLGTGGDETEATRGRDRPQRACTTMRPGRRGWC